MADTTYIDYTTPAVNAAWLNEINDHVWHDTPVSGAILHSGDKISFTQAGIGAILRTDQDKLRETISVKDFGAVGDGIVDDTAKIQAAINYAATQGKKCLINAGLYNITDSINTPNNCWLEFETGAWLVPSQHSTVGAIITNAAVLPKARTNITLVNPQVDGSNLSFTGISQANDNGIGFATGVSKVRIYGGHIKGFRANFDNGPGGKGIGFEEGVEDVLVFGTLIEKCTYATFISPTLDDANKYTRNIRFVNVHSKQCAAVLWAIADAGTALEPTSDPMLCSADWIGCTADSVGHMPDADATTGKFEKSGAICIQGASNLNIDLKIVNPIGFPSATYPAGGTLYPTGYPASTANKIGSGLSGPIGAVIKGWGRNININVHYVGECDDVVNAAFVREHTGLSFAGSISPINAFGFNVAVIHRGTKGTVIRSGHVGGFTGTLAAGGTTSITLPSTAPLRDGEYAGLNITTTGGTGSGQTKRILTYVGSTRVATVDTAFSPALDETTTFSISGSTSAVADGEIAGNISIECDSPTIGLVDASARFPKGYLFAAMSPTGRQVKGSLYITYRYNNTFSSVTQVGDTWTPVVGSTLIGVTNVAALTAYTCNYVRQDAIVFISGFVSVDPTSTGSTIFDMDLPIATNLVTSTQVSGVFSDTNGESGNFFAEVVGEKMRFSYVTTNVTNRLFAFTGSYRIY